ncbi:SelT/SelW/SelH family protein [Belliella kenyensis]|uniref:SelT/SelW/SelH family protein n=1 Tax=Belliella kenyensis TaxID=1472724 RepID=A0ABV8EI25_9BACT|nr:SelT/SelW/SelH family protein [Belliella kenyensis]MCH7401362.1 SelT/SelW/SelH family protein [Belliella kenyensis]MDN3602805.1 SelT/SelW/SelH family protein [Belliella kenyensis]
MQSEKPTQLLGSFPDENFNQIEIHYCTQCRWMLRSVWMSQELLTTFDGDISAMTLRPGTGGVFEIYVNDTCIWSRKKMGGFPEVTELKQLVRDIIAPNKSLGHAEKKNK